MVRINVLMMLALTRIRSVPLFERDPEMHFLILILFFCLCFPWCTAKTDILWPTLLRSRGYSMRQWRKTSSLAALSANRGEDRVFFCGAGWSRALRGELCCPRYKAVIDACSLQPDIDLLPFGDQTEIGERVRPNVLYSSVRCTSSSGCIISSVVLLWFRGLTWAEVRGRGSVWPELFTRTPTLSSWWVRLYQSSNLKHPQWWWQSKYFPYYSIASLLEELQPPFLYGWFQDSCTLASGTRRCPFLDSVRHVFILLSDCVRNILLPLYDFSVNSQTFYI